MFCCGERHTTPYCPHCGTKLSPDNSREGLILYLIQQRDIIKESHLKGRGKDDLDKIREFTKTKAATLRLFRDWIADLSASAPPVPTMTPSREKKASSKSPKKKSTSKKKAATKKTVKKKVAKKSPPPPESRAEQAEYAVETIVE